MIRVVIKRDESTDKITSIEVKEFEEGDAYIKALDIPSDHDAVVLYTIEIQLKTVEEFDPGFVQVKNL